MHIQLTDQQLQYLVNVLADQPFKHVVEIMQSIQQQVGAQQGGQVAKATTTLQEVKK